MTRHALTSEEIDLLRVAVGVAAAREAALARQKTANAHHLKLEEAFRQLHAKLHDHLCVLVDDDIIMLNTRRLPLAERQAIIEQHRNLIA